MIFCMHFKTLNDIDDRLFESRNVLTSPLVERPDVPLVGFRVEPQVPSLDHVNGQSALKGRVEQAHKQLADALDRLQ